MNENEQDDINKKLLGIDLAICGMAMEINRTRRHMCLACNARNYLRHQQKLLDLVEFCQTGRYSQ